MPIPVCLVEPCEILQGFTCSDAQTAFDNLAEMTSDSQAAPKAQARPNKGLTVSDR